MRIMLISGNPKQDGLCQSVIAEALAGAEAAGAETAEIRLSDHDLIRCQVCREGWGNCRDKDTCTYGADGFNHIQEKLAKADALIMATPVYWGETSETLKSFLDRLRRCEFGENGHLAGKPVILIASAGGSGNGILTCLDQMEQFCRHTSIQVFDRFGINRWNNDYQKKAVYTAAEALASGRHVGDTVSVSGKQTAGT